MIDLWINDQQDFKIRCSITDCKRHKECICNAYRYPDASFKPAFTGHLVPEGRRVRLRVECRSRQ